VKIMITHLRKAIRVAAAPALLLVSFAFAQVPSAPAQTQKESAGSTTNLDGSPQPSSDSAAPVVTTAGKPAVSAAKIAEPAVPELTKELELMKARIEQLELALKARAAADQPAAATAAVPSESGGPGPPPVQPQADSTPSPAAAPAKQAKIAPFSDWDWTWLNGNPRNKDSAFDSKFFTPEIRADISYNYDFNKPKDNSEGGSSEIFRSNEIQLEQLGIGGDFHLDNVRARFMTQFGMYSSTTPRNDPSSGKGQWDLANAYRYVSEAYGGYHINALNGINVDAGIFMSYIGLFSYYNYDNWAYQPSYVSSNTPWFFNGVRIQIFPTAHLKIEPWIINGWQSYGSANTRKGLGGQIKWTPRPWINIISNNYGLGHDDLYIPNRGRIHTDNSVEIKYFDKPQNTLDKMAFSVTGDMGCEFGGGVSCHGNTAGGPKQSFLGYMIYNRMWFKKDLYGLTVGGGQINNPGRYLVLIPPINGETAATAAQSSPYFTGNPGDPFKAWDSSITFDYMPKQWITFRWEYDYRHASVPYWTGAGGITPPPGTNNGFPTQFACNNGSPSPTATGCVSNGGLWSPDLRKDQQIIDFDILVKF
jgi:Putative beta-barrel porin-2, OmpL-like. bbp2